MKRLTKSQYESIAYTIFSTRQETETFEHLPKELLKQREIAFEQIVSDLMETFRCDDDKFDYNAFWSQCRYGSDD